jgi:hypothetical protein
MDIPVSRSQVDFNLKAARRIRAVKIDMGDIVEPQHRLSSRTKPPENPPDLLQVISRNPPVNMDEIGIDRQQHHFRFLIDARQLLRLALHCGRRFSGLGFPLLGGFYFFR